MSMFTYLTSGQFIQYVAPNPFTEAFRMSSGINAESVRYAMLDSPYASGHDNPVIAVMCVPAHREKEWLFCTKEGHKRLMQMYFNLSRLYLIGNNPDKCEETMFTKFTQLAHFAGFADELHAIFDVLSPVDAQGQQLELHILSYVDDIKVRRKVAVSDDVGEEYSIVDEELVDGAIRRRLRFKSCPGFIQAEVQMKCEDDVYSGKDYEDLMNEGIHLVVDKGSLVDEFSPSMVGGLSLISNHLSTIGQPRVLCLGLGVGALSEFLRVNLGFKIVGVERNTSIITNAGIFYDFNKSDDNVVINEDAIDVVNQFASGSRNIFKAKFRKFLDRVGAGEKFQAIILDINSVDKRAPFGVSSPPANFVSNKCLTNMSKCLDDHGLLIINVVSPNYVFYCDLVESVKTCYPKVFKSKPDDEQTFILYALKSAKDLSGNSDFIERLLRLVPDCDIKGIVEV